MLRKSVTLDLVFQVLYAKLFLVLGLTWSFEPLSELLRSQGMCTQVCSNINVAVNAINLLRGVAMFVIFVCKRSCLEKIWRFLQSKQTATPAGSLELQVMVEMMLKNPHSRQKELSHIEFVLRLAPYLRIF